MRIRSMMLLLFIAIAASASAAVDFSGRWALDPAWSTGLPPGMEQTLVVEQNGDTLNVATTLITDNAVGSSRVDLQACKLEYSIVSPK